MWALLGPMWPRSRFFGRARDHKSQVPQLLVSLPPAVMTPNTGRPFQDLGSCCCLCDARAMPHGRDSCCSCLVLGCAFLPSHLHVIPLAERVQTINMYGVRSSFMTSSHNSGGCASHPLPTNPPRCLACSPTSQFPRR